MNRSVPPLHRFNVFVLIQLQILHGVVNRTGREKFIVSPKSLPASEWRREARNNGPPGSQNKIAGEEIAQFLCMKPQNYNVPSVARSNGVDLTPVL